MIQPVKLNTLKTGQSAKIVGITNDPIKSRLIRMGVKPGDVVEILSRTGSVAIKTRSTRLAIGDNIAKNILVDNVSEAIQRKSLFNQCSDWLIKILKRSK